jgi:salicylate hydroxylase
VVGCDGGKSLVRQQYSATARAFPDTSSIAQCRRGRISADLKYNAPVVWCGPNCHLVHYPLRGGQQYNVVVTFHSRKTETWSITDGSQEEVLTYFHGHRAARAPAALAAEELEAVGDRRSRADRAMDLRPRHTAR